LSQAHAKADFFATKVLSIIYLEACGVIQERAKGDHSIIMASKSLSNIQNELNNFVHLALIFTGTILLISLLGWSLGGVHGLK
jgi:hypothetical protein